MIFGTGGYRQDVPMHVLSQGVFLSIDKQGAVVRFGSIWVSVLLLAVSACSTVTVNPDGRAKLVSEPSYQDSKSFFLWGLIGEHHVDVLRICNGKEPAQMQSQQTFLDGFLTGITLGIYAPHSTKVWCSRGQS
ncbi:MAG TPA: Bor family protein [Burkholderiaceae bacterium]|nr:Bor family protein [Burkholderiaceae bacterium]